MSDVMWIAGVLAGLQVKHFFADYLLQTGWMIQDKADLRKLGGYAHAATHAAGSMVILAAAGVHVAPVAMLAAAEMVAHYAIDFAKAHVSSSWMGDPKTRRFWAIHGADQLAHHLTYAVILGAAITAERTL